MKAEYYAHGVKIVLCGSNSACYLVLSSLNLSCSSNFPDSYILWIPRSFHVTTGFYIKQFADRYTHICPVSTIHGTHV
jgi:hypothetical protein